MATLTAHRIQGLHAIDAEHAALQRWTDVDGHPVAVTLCAHAAGVTLETRDGSRALDQAVCERVRGWFDLDADIAAIDAAIVADPVLGPLVAERPGVRITRFHSAYEAALFTVIGQQVSLAAARLFGSRLIAAYGAEAPGPAFGGGLRMLPAPQVIACQPVEELCARIGPTGARARTVLAVAELFADLGDTENLPGRATLAAYGVGPWTLDYLAVRVGTDPDAFPAGDAVLRRVLAARGAADPAAAAEDWAAMAQLRRVPAVGRCLEKVLEIFGPRHLTFAGRGASPRRGRDSVRKENGKCPTSEASRSVPSCSEACTTTSSCCPTPGMPAAPV
ncbi:DNA-3-methyladenine glycosylase family protein [Streptomyces sp. NPDC004227]